jgi:pimeloyl-ACP methyl ester carboxylesterase
MRVTTHGVSLEYDDIGNGVPLILIHGFPHDRTLWRYQLEGLQKVARVIALDLRGFGASSAAPDVMQMDDYASDVKALLDSLGVERPVMGGLSMGGYIALAYVKEYPHNMRGLILSNTRAAADSESAREGRYATADKALAGGVAEIAESLLPKMLTQATITQRASLAGYVKKMMARQPAEGIAAALKGMAGRPDRTALLPEIKVPVLIITAQDDTLIPVSESEAMAKAIPNSTLVNIPAAAHLPNLEQSDAFNNAVKDFLSKLK